MTEQELRDELANDPAGLGYAAHVAAADDLAAAAILNAPRDTVLSYAPIADLQAALHKLTHESGLPVWIVVRQQAVSSENAAVKATCELIIDITQARYQNVDMGLTNVDTALSVLVAATVLTSEQKTTLLELGRRDRSRAEVLWGLGTKVTPQQVGAAR